MGGDDSHRRDFAVREESFSKHSAQNPDTAKLDGEQIVVDVQDDALESPSHLDYSEEENRAIVRKLDIHILPIIWACYLFNSLDRNNLSNAKSDGMPSDLNFPPNGYNTLLSCFTVTFCLFAVPGTMLTRKVGPQWTIPGYMLVWGAMALLNAACTDFAGALVVRLLLGTFEAGYAASLIYYLTTFYTRSELGLRVAAFYSCSALSGAFSGLIAYGAFQVPQGGSGLKGWQILFLIEGALTVVCAALSAILLPPSTSRARFLTPRQQAIARLRVLRDGSRATGTPFSLATYFAPLRDPVFYAFAAIALCYGMAASTASYFLTQIIGRFGLSTVLTNLYTVAPYACGTLAVLLTAWSSDRRRERGLHLASSMVFVIVGCVLLVALPVDQVGAGYFATFLITLGAFTPSVLFHTWHQCNDPSEDGRAFRVGAYTLLANTGAFVSANVFLDRWAPHYVIPLSITCGIEGLGLVLVLMLRTWMWMENGRRNREQGLEWESGDVPTDVLADGPKNPKFRYFY